VRIHGFYQGKSRLDRQNGWSRLRPLGSRSAATIGDAHVRERRAAGAFRRPLPLTPA
jgi:hypothetical protein